jgi:serine/threonine protein kinase
VKFLGWYDDRESNQSPTFLYLAMDYVPHGSLADNFPLNLGMIGSESEIQSISLQILEALRIMHQEGFVHRDLKPQVILPIARWILTSANLYRMS